MKEESIDSTMFKEKCWFIWGIRIKSFMIGILQYSSEGETCSVEFNWEKGLSKFLLGWFHSHPRDISLKPSYEDEKTMRSWVRTLERPLICGIMYEQKEKPQFLHVSCYEFKRWPGNKIYYQPLLKARLIGPIFICL